MVYPTLILFLISCLVLVVSGGFLVKLIVKIASYSRLSEFVVAFMKYREIRVAVLKQLETISQ
ncbi:hypothetical protein HYT51_00485 [Candidatus Woesearchaeota archaeon]|nr:hypothetical protein [Candidatus Woesearchaeota archaeon]